MNLIGLTGFARVGKDTACRLLHGRRLAFADALKEDLSEIVRLRYGFDPHALTAEQKEIVRPLYVAHGMVGRAVDPAMWIAPVLRCIDFLRRCLPPLPHEEGNAVQRGKGRPIVVCDVRYANEARALLDIGARIVYIDRPGYGPANDEERASFDEMMSDPALWKQIQPVINDGTEADLGRKLRVALGHSDEVT